MKYMNNVKMLESDRDKYIRSFVTLWAFNFTIHETPTKSEMDIFVEIIKNQIDHGPISSAQQGTILKKKMVENGIRPTVTNITSLITNLIKNKWLTKNGRGTFLAASQLIDSIKKKKINVSLRYVDS